MWHGLSYLRGCWSLKMSHQIYFHPMCISKYNLFPTLKTSSVTIKANKQVILSGLRKFNWIKRHDNSQKGKNHKKYWLLCINILLGSRYTWNFFLFSSSNFKIDITKFAFPWHWLEYFNVMFWCLQCNLLLKLEKTMSNSMVLVHPCPLQLSCRPHVFTSREPLNNPHNAILWPENRRQKTSASKYYARWGQNKVRIWSPKVKEINH